MNEEFDPTVEIGISGTGLSEQETAEAVINMQEAEQERAALREQEAQEEEAKAEANKPDQGANLGDYITDTVKAPIAGLRDAGANLITIPERVIDFVSGEMQEEDATEEGYQTEWDSFCLLYTSPSPRDRG